MKKQALNPYLPSWEYVPDGEPRVFGDRLYVYGSHDRFEGDDYCANDYVCWSAPLEDLGDWRYEGVIYRSTQDPRNLDGQLNLFAPDCVQGPDGRFYLYYQLNRLACTCVAVSDRPEGPFAYYGAVSHGDGTPWGEKKGDCFAFDPGVLVDDDGSIYLYIGFAPFRNGARERLMEQGRNVDGAVCLKLAQDMKTVISEELPIAPGHCFTQGTGFEEHGFFEASSPRKIGGKYYFVYSSEKSHELCYAVSDRPDGGFRYCGTLVSNGDVGYQGRIQPNNHTGNTHGGMVEIGGQWYLFYHRHTNLQKCARQGCAEKISILPDGSIPQVEMTSCGLNDGPLMGKGRYEARIACNLVSSQGTVHCNLTRHTEERLCHPYFTQSGGDREGDGDQYIANMQQGAMAGFKYFRFEQAASVKISVRGSGEGTMEVLDGECGSTVAVIPVKPSRDWTDFEACLNLSDGVHPLLFRFAGTGSLDFRQFTLA